MLKYPNKHPRWSRLQTWLKAWCSDTGGILIIALALYIGIYISWFLFSSLNSTFNLVIADLFYSLPPLLALGFIGRAILSTGLQRQLRFAWLMLGIAVTMFVIGEAISITVELLTGDAPVFPSVADIFFICFYPLAMIALLSFPFSQYQAAERFAFWIDIAMVMVVMIMLLWHFNIEALVTGEYQNTFEIVVTFGYPLGDLFLLFGVTVIILRDSAPESRNPLLLLAAAFFILCLTDVSYVYQQTVNEYEAANVLDIAWTIMYFLIALSAQYQIWTIKHPEQSLKVLFSRSFRLIPYSIVVLGYGLIIKVLSENWVQPIVTMLLGAILLSLLVIMRQVIVMRENDKLRTALEERNSQLLSLSMTDSLTEISNRRAFDTRLDEEIARTHRYNEALTLIMVDVDLFKNYNDSYGHLAGDMVLQIVAQLLRQYARPIDMVARYGGEEFALLLPNTDLANGIIAAERLRHIIASYDWPHQPITASFGVASSSGSATQADILQHQADTALYQAKIKRNDVQALYEV